MDAREALLGAMYNKDHPRFNRAEAEEGTDRTISRLNAAGFQIVPKLPTDEMRIAAINTSLPKHLGDFPYEEIYRAMLSACRVNETGKKP